MPDPRDEVRAAVSEAIQHLKALAEKKPDTPIKGEDFNMLLAQAKKVYPNLPMVQGVTPVAGGTNMGELMFKLSMLNGAIQTDWAARIEIQNEEYRRRYPDNEF